MLDPKKLFIECYVGGCSIELFAVFAIKSFVLRFWRSLYYCYFLFMTGKLFGNDAQVQPLLRMLPHEAFSETLDILLTYLGGCHNQRLTDSQ